MLVNQNKGKKTTWLMAELESCGFADKKHVKVFTSYR